MELVKFQLEKQGRIKWQIEGVQIEEEEVKSPHL